jgi:hypothetical protein
MREREREREREGGREIKTPNYIFQPLKRSEIITD